MNQSVVKKRYFDQINNIIDLNKLSHAYLIEIDNYEKDFSFILDFVKLILCNNVEENNYITNCGKCNVCNQIDNNAYVDLKIVEPDGSMIKKRQLLELQDEFHNKSLLGNKRIYIIKEADKLNDSSANTMLKFLEEPEEDIIALLVTTNRYKIIDTILSRCQVLSLQDNFNEIDISDSVIDIIKSIVKKDSLFINYNTIYNDILPDKGTAKIALEEVEKIFINYLNYILNKDESFYNENVVNILSNVDNNFITNCISIIEEELQKLDFNVNYKLWLDCLFARLIGG